MCVTSAWMGWDCYPVTGSPITMHSILVLYIPETGVPHQSPHLWFWRFAW